MEVFPACWIHSHHDQGNVGIRYLDGSRIKMEIVPTTGTCSDCGAPCSFDMTPFTCPACGAFNIELNGAMNWIFHILKLRLLSPGPSGRTKKIIRYTRKFTYDKRN